MIIEINELRVNESIQEIENLRERNAKLETQARVLDIFERAMQGSYPSYGASPDVIWRVKQDINAFKNKHVTEEKENDPMPNNAR